MRRENPSDVPSMVGEPKTRAPPTGKRPSAISASGKSKNKTIIPKLKGQPKSTITQPSRGALTYEERELEATTGIWFVMRDGRRHFAPYAVLVGVDMQTAGE